MNRLEIILNTVPDCADCEAINRLLNHEHMPFIEKNVRGDPKALAEMQTRADGVRIAPVTVIRSQAFYGRFDEHQPRILATITPV